MPYRALPVFVFFCLVIAAFLTAFYTWRQISMTFLGKPRTESAATPRKAASPWSCRC